jgi:chemotaxis protein methyltransferase CheR
MRADNLEFLIGWLGERVGFALATDQMHLVENRLLPVARKLGLASLDAMIAELRAGARRAGEFAPEIVDAMMNAETGFFRDAGAFARLRDHVLPGLVAARQPSRRMRILCAGASTGQEAYSMAMLVRRPEVGLDGWQVDLVAIDVCRQSVARGRAGAYSHFEIQMGLPVQQMLRHFRRQQERWVASETLRRSISFREFNLLEDPAPLGVFDLVLCRYVLRGCTPAGRVAILGRLASVVAPDGRLWLGGGEAVPEDVAAFRPLDGLPALYAMAGQGAAGA